MKKAKESKIARLLSLKSFFLALFFIATLLYLNLTLPPEASAENGETGYYQAVAMLNSHKNEVSHEFRQIKRELALLKESMSKPGLTEILGGIGYILGLFGLSYYWQARNQIKANK